MPPSYFGTRWFSQLVRRCGLGDATHRIFVDESGDPTLFDGDGNVIVGREGVSQFFMLGAVHLPNPDAAHRKLERLRRSLLADPYFATAPSMSKTALTFHAKNDLDEVKREVFRILPELGGTVQIAVRRKHDMVREARELFPKRHASDAEHGV